MNHLNMMPGHLIRRMQQVVQSIYLARVGSDVTPVQYAALYTILKHPNIDQGTLSEMIAYDRATIVGVIDRLERKKLVKRTVKKQDRRARELTITSAGIAMEEKIRPLATDMQTEVLTGLDADERVQFVKLLTKLTKHWDNVGNNPNTNKPKS